MNKSANTIALTALLVMVFAVNLLAMPASFYPGDPVQIRLEGISLLQGKLATASEAAQYLKEELKQEVYVNPANTCASTCSRSINTKYRAYCARHDLCRSAFLCVHTIYL
jgi:hypothetical protein